MVAEEREPLEHEAEGRERPDGRGRSDLHGRVLRAAHQLDQRGLLPGLVGLDRAGGARSHVGLLGVVTRDVEQHACHLGRADLGDDLDDDARIVGEQERGLLEHRGDREGAQPTSERRASGPVGLGERAEDALAGIGGALHVERTRGAAARDALRGVVVAGQHADGAEHPLVAQLGEVADARREHVGRWTSIEHVDGDRLASA